MTLNTVTLRALKGAPLSILTAMLCLTDAPIVTQAYLCSSTAYSPEAIARGLQTLHALHFAHQVGRFEWQATPRARQLRLALQLDSVISGVNTPTTTTTTIEGPYSALEDLAVAAETTPLLAESPKLSTVYPQVYPQIYPQAGSAPSARQALLTILAAAGIGEPTRSRLAALPHVTPAYVTAHAADLRRRGKGGETGLLIHRLLQADPPPPHPTGCGCDACRARYLGGEFSQYLET